MGQRGNRRQYAGENQTKRAEGMGHREDTSGIID